VINTTPILQMQRLAKRYGGPRGIWAIQEVEFSVHSGEVVGLVGPNGAGKTTSMSIVAGLVAPTSGTVSYGGRRCLDRQPRPWLGAWVGEPGFYGHLSGQQHIRAVASLRGTRLSVGDAVDRLNTVGLGPDVAGRRVKSYSTGMRQRLAYAMATVGDPPVVMLDEPTAGLDPEGIRLLLDDLIRRASDGAAVLVSSHRLAEIESVADRIVLLVGGKSEELSTDAGMKVARLRCDDVTRAEELARGYGGVARLGRVLVIEDGRAGRANAIRDLLRRSGIEITSVESGPATLEERFLLQVAKRGEDH
jgi:ABC-2 type transport system ATP-binding protein